MTQGRRIAIGIDSGGTLTRVMVSDLAGRVLGYVEGRSGNPLHNSDAQGNVRDTIYTALERTGKRVSDVAVIVAGVAGVDSDADQPWADELLALTGVTGPTFVMNDTVTAHAGVFGPGPGVVAISGTGSNIFGRTEAGNCFTNGDYGHYAGAARHLARYALHRLLIEAEPGDLALIERILRLWKCPTLAAVRSDTIRLDRTERNAYKQLLGRTAELVTGAVEESPTAAAACDWLAGELAIGIALIALECAADQVGVGLVGAVATSRSQVGRSPNNERSWARSWVARYGIVWPVPRRAAIDMRG